MEVKKKNILYVGAVILGVILLVGLFVVINFSQQLGFYKKDKGTTTTMTTTTKKVNADKESEVHQEVVIMEGMEETLNVKTYSSHKKFQMDYDIDYFSPIKSDTSIIFKDTKDLGIYIEVESLKEKDYFQEYNKYLETEENYKDEKEVDGYTYEYKFLRANGVFLRVTKCLKDDSEFDGMNIRMNYMINSLYITQITPR